MSASTVTQEYNGTFPLDFNGYVTVARPALRVRADEVQQDDLILLDGYLSKVTQPPRVLGPLPNHGGQVVFIPGHLNIVRFPHEIVSVIR